MRIDQDSVPSTIEEAVNRIVANVTEEECEAIRQSSTAEHHFSVGMSLRNHWSLWDNDSPLKRDAAAKYGIAHADDISGLMLEWARARICGIEFDPILHCEQYHEHWAKYGKTSLQAGGWEGNT